MEWIKVTERHPKVLKKVIYRTDKPIHKPTGMSNRQVFWGYWNGYNWSDENSIEYTHIENVIEWLDEREITLPPNNIEEQESGNSINIIRLKS